MNKTALAVAKLQLKNIKVAYLVAGICATAVIIQLIVAAILLKYGIDMIGEDNSNISIAWYCWLLVLIAAIVIPSGNFTRIINLGATRRDYFWGTLLAYTGLTGLASLVVILMTYLIDRPLNNWGAFGVFWTAPDIFGWSAHGAVVAFFQQWAFLMLFAAFVHTLVAAQDKWYGWVADVTIIAIISVFTPITPLRHAEAWFFNLILFHHNALLQIVACLVLAALVYAISRPILARRAV